MYLVLVNGRMNSIDVIYKYPRVKASFTNLIMLSNLINWLSKKSTIVKYIYTKKAYLDLEMDKISPSMTKN